jgi:glutathione S-transferase
MTDRATLYGSPHSQFTYKVALMLQLAAEPFSFRYVSFQKGMHRTKEFRALSPWAEVPVLCHRGRTMVQSAAILEYLAAVSGKFGGQTDERRQRIREWLYWDAHRLAPPIHALHGVYLADQKLLPIAYDPAIADYHRTRATAALATLDEQLGMGRHRYDGDFLVGPQPTIADIACYGDVSFAEVSGIKCDDWSEVSRWTGKIKGLHRFKSTHELLPMADAELET